MVHVSVAIKKITLKRGTRSFLCITGCFCFIFIISKTQKYILLSKKKKRICKISHLLQLYQELPCGSQGPKHTQQKSALQFWFLQTIWLHPPSFSIVTLHLGHSLVFAAIQLLVSESSSHFLIHFLSKWHFTGSCQFSPHEKQNVWLHLHVTRCGSTYCTFIALLQSGEGHHLNKRLH